MTISQFFSILRARWIVALAMLATVVVLVVGASLVWPKSYTATASLVVDAKPDLVSSSLYGAGATSAFLATQVDILQSERVAQRVVRNLNLADNPQVRAQWQDATGGQGSVESWLGEQFQRSMDVKPSRESNVITVTYKSPDPRFAAGLANGFVQAYIDTSLEMRVNPAKSFSAFFDTRLKEARDAMEKNQARLSEFQKANGITANDERLDIENSRLNELSSQLVALQALASESGSRQAQANSASGDRMQEVLGNPLIAGIKSDISRGEARLQELNIRLGDEHPQVREAKASLAELRSRLDAETRKVTGGVGVTNIITRQREAEVRASLEQQRAKVLRLKAVRDEAQVLQRDVENAQRAYDTVQARLTQTSLESQANQTNAYPLSTATPPLQPSSPRVTLNALVAVFLGTMLAVGVALVLEFMDRRVRVASDVVAALGLPLLGTLPDGNARGARSNLGGQAMKQRVLGQISGPVAKGA
jgi:chain length determinant protein EpsF